MKVCIVGAGYVGLVTGACFAERGHEVVCVDTDPLKVDSIMRGVAPIHEEGLNALLAGNAGRRLKAQTTLEDAVLACDVTLVCVGTPFRDGKIDLSYVIEAAAQIGRALRKASGYKLIAMKSTVIPGTTEGIFRKTLEEQSGKTAGADFGLGMNPEFLTEGTAVADFLRPDRIVVGGIDERSRETLLALYRAWPDVPRVATLPGTAEMIKYTSNAVLATLISFSNEIARLCEAVGGIDVVDVMRGVHLAGYFTVQKPGADAVVAPITSFLGAGCGFGGSCLPKDVSALAAQGGEKGLSMSMLRSVLEVNKTQPQRVMKLLERHFASLKGRRVSVLGIAFKPDTDDVRESPAFPLIRLLKEQGAELTAYDPVARPQGLADLAQVRWAEDLRTAVSSAEAIVVVTSWREFNALPAILRELGREPLVVDGRRMLRREDVKRYEGIGLG